MKKLILVLITVFAFSVLPASAGPLKTAGTCAVKGAAKAAHVTAKGAKTVGKSLRKLI
jgi:hypothetical protein